MPKLTKKVVIEFAAENGLLLVEEKHKFRISWIHTPTDILYPCDNLKEANAFIAGVRTCL